MSKSIQRNTGRLEFASVSSMRSFVGGAGLKGGETVYLHDSDNPGNWEWSTSSTASDDGVDVVKIASWSGAGRFLRLKPNAENISYESRAGTSGKALSGKIDGLYVDVKADYGATGDGSADDTTAIQSAFTFAKSNPGVTVYFPKGVYKVTTTIDATYSGSSGGYSSGYYGFAVKGEDRYNTYILGATSNTPVIDMTGKPHMTFDDFGIYSQSDDATAPSCAILEARNATLGGAGNHIYTNCFFRGYYQATVVMSASSEVNKYVNCKIDQWKTGTGPAVTIMEQLQYGITSPYIDIDDLHQEGGITRTAFIGCELSNIVGNGGSVMRIQGVDNLDLVSCYTKGRNGNTFQIEGENTNIHLVDIRDESDGTGYFINLYGGEEVTASTISFDASDNSINDSGSGLGGFTAGDTLSIDGSSSNDGSVVIDSVAAGKLVVSGLTLTNEAAGSSITLSTACTLDSFSFTGRSGRQIVGEDYSTITLSEIDPSFLATNSTYSIDLYNCTRTDIKQSTNDVRIRNDGAETRIWQYKSSSSVSVPSTDENAVEEQRISYSGGQSNYKRIKRNANKYSRLDEGRVSSQVLNTPEQAGGSTTTSQTPDLDVGSCFSYIAGGNFTIQNPTNSQPNTDDGNGNHLFIAIQQDATGSRTVSFGSAYELAGRTVDTTANAWTGLHFVQVNGSAGDKWVAV